MASSDEREYLIAKLSEAIDNSIHELGVVKATLERRLAPDGVIDGRIDSLEIDLLLMQRIIKKVIGD